MIEKQECHGRLPLVTPTMKIGLLGGSFDPPHSGHRNISLVALKRLGLDQVWWLVSPNNPLKQKQPWSLKKRLEQCDIQANHPKIKVTGFECERDNYYTADSLLYLKRRFHSTKFVWLMGADNLENIHHWYQWHKIFSLMPILIMDRPGFRYSALFARANYFYQDRRVQEPQLGRLASFDAPSWGLLSLPLNAISSSQIRAKN